MTRLHQAQKTSRVAVRSASIAAVCLTSACGHLIVPYDVSAPATLPPGLQGEIDDGRTTLHLDDLDLQVEARNPRAGAVSLGLVPLGIIPFPMILPARETTADLVGKALLMFLEFDPAEPGYAFAPMAVRLALAGSDAKPPRAYVGPGRAWGGMCLDPVDQRAELARSTENRSHALEPGEDPTCFVLRFETAVLPENPFRLELDGLTRDGAPQLVPALDFSKRREHSFGGPWTWRPEAFD